MFLKTGIMRALSKNLISGQFLPFVSTIDEHFAGYMTGIMLFVFALFAFGGTSAFAEVFQDGSNVYSPASHYRSLSDPLSLTVSQGEGTSEKSPVSHYRLISESMAVSANHGKVAISYSRSMSEQVALSTEMPSSSISQQLRGPPASYLPNSSHRIDERLGQRGLPGNREDTLACGVVVAEQQENLTCREETFAKAENTNFQEVATHGIGEGAKADGSGHIQLYYAMTVSGTFAIAVVLAWRGNPEKKSRHLTSCYQYFIIRVRRIASLLLVFAVIMSITVSILSVTVSAFGNDYRPLTTVSPGDVDNTSTVIFVDIGLLEDGRGTYVVDPYSTSSVEGMPSTTSLSGFGWRTAGVIGSTIPAGTWSFNVAANSNLLLSTGVAVARVYVYSTDIHGSNISFIGTDTGSVNLFNTLALGTVQTDTLAFSAPEVDLTNRIIVVEYWIDVTSSPLLDVTLTFRAGSSNQAIDLPPASSVDYYLGTMLHSIALEESASMSDSVLPTARKQISDGAITTDSVSIGATKPVSDSAAITDTIKIGVAKILSDDMTFDEEFSRSFGALRQSPEQMIVTDALARTSTFSRTSTEQFVLTDTISIAVSKTIFDQFTVSHTSARRVVQSVPIFEELGLTGAIGLSKTISIADQFVISDMSATTTAVRTSASDQLGMTEMVTIKVTKLISDGFSVTDVVIIAGSSAMTDPLIITDTVATSLVITRTVSDSLTMTDGLSGSHAIFIALSDSMSISDSFSDISATLSLTLDELIVIVQGFSTDFEGIFDQIGNEGILIGDSVMLMLSSVISPSESMAIHDQVLAFQTPGRALIDFMQTRDSILILVTRPPPPPPSAITAMPNLFITETEYVDEFADLTGPIRGTDVDGTWNIDDLDEEGLERLLQDIGMPVYDIELEAASGDIHNLTIVLPTFKVSMEDELSNDGAFLTPNLSSLPAGMQVIIPIDVESSMDGAENLDLLRGVTVNFTPAEDTGDFSMLITILDNNPETDMAQEPPDGLPAFFIDVTILGDFTGLTPDTEEFFEEPPQVTFTVTEEWANEKDTKRDANSVPIIGLHLLDESTGEWIELTEELEPPTTSIDDVYTYSAALPHFSTYVVTADTTSPQEPSDDDPSSSLGGGRSGGTTLVNPTETEPTPSDLGIPSEGRIVIKEITDSFAFSILQQKPLHQRVITVHNVTVAVDVLDVKMAGLFGPAVALLNFEITNRGDLDETLTIRYWYLNSEGRPLFENEHNVAINGGISIVQTAEVPFNSAGVYDVIIEVKTDGETLSSTDITVEVPWLAANLYLLVLIAALVIAASIAYVIYIMRSRFARSES